MNIDKKVDLETVATQMVEASGADIRAITQEAGMFTIRERETMVKSNHFLSAIDKVITKKKEALTSQSEYT